MTIIGGGAGSFLVQNIAADLQTSYQSVAQCMSEINVGHQQEIELCLPAYAVARLRLINESLSSSCITNIQVNE